MKTIIRLTLISLGFITVCFSCSQCKEIPKVKTEEVTTPSDNSAKITGTITDDGNATITKEGFYYGTSPKPETSGVEAQNVTEGTTSFSSTILSLDPNTKYYVKAYAINSQGTGYGNEVSFSTTSVTDIDGNVYNTVKIGTQTWMKENLKTTKYKDDASIPLVTNGALWAALSTPGYCWYNNDAATYKTTYGALYNWYAVSTGKLCPTGWHVPTDTEWNSLSDYLTNNGFGFGGSGSDIGKSMASSSGWTLYGTAGSVGNDQVSNNSSGFAGQPGGARDFYGSFLDLKNFAYWWSSTEFGIDKAYDRYLYFQLSDLYKNDVNFTKQDGFSVRCIKDL